MEATVLYSFIHLILSSFLNSTMFSLLSLIPLFCFFSYKYGFVRLSSQIMIMFELKVTISHLKLLTGLMFLLGFFNNFDSFRMNVIMSLI